MKKFWLAGLFVALVSVFISCGNEINEVSENTNTTVSGETYIVIGSSSVARTIRPTSSEVKALESSLTDFTFVGVDSNENQKNFTETAISTFTELKKQKFAIVPGTWSFTLSAKLGEDGATFSDTLENIVIESGKTTALTFVLESEDCGGLSIKVKFADENVTHINVSLTKLGEPSFDAREKTFNKLNSDESTDFVTEKEGEVTEYSVTYSCDGTNASEELSAGTYHLVFDFYSEGTDVPINSIPYDVRVLGGITTSATQSVKINETYTITYVLNDDEASPAEIASGVMTTKFSRKCEPIDYPEMKREGYIWGGWRFDEDSTEVVAGLASEATGDVTVYARWYEPKLYVSASGSSSNSGFYDSEPVDSIGNAISTIKRFNASDFDWTIYIDGTVYGTYTLDLDSDFANTLTFEGVHENKDDNYTDILDGGSVYTENESDATIKGSVFTVYSYCVPVIIRNLKITHGISSRGYGGAFDTSGNITLEDGAWVTDNHTYYSGGAVVNSGTFTMKEGSRITNNSSKDWGGGVWTGGGSFIMEGGEISGNTSSRGLAIDVSGEFRIGGTASIPAGDDPDNPQDVCLSSESPFTPDSITITDNLSGISSVIKIRADSQYEGLQILNTVDGVELTSDIISKFEIVQPSDGTDTWYITETGTLSKN